MAKDTSTNIHRVGTVLHTDHNPKDQPKGTHRFALNAVSEASDGHQGIFSNEKSNIDVTTLTQGFFPIGDRYIENDLSVIISVNPVTGHEEIGLLNRNNTYTTVVSTNVLGLSINHQCDIRYRLRRGNERVIYWVDGLNRARTFNLDRPHNFYTNAYQAYLKAGGNPNTYVDDKWDASSFDLIKTYKTIPFFADCKIIETGNILPGSYNFAIQYVDEDLNPTEWITTSNIVRIYNDTVTNPFERIRGSKNTQTLAQTFDRANKSIKLTITNLDIDFPYYRIAIIRAAGTTGDPEKVLASDLHSTSDGNFTYSGNDSQLKEVNLADILIDKEIIYAPRHLEQLENRLVVAHGKGKGINWCDFQKFASKIDSDLTTKEVVLNSVLSEANIKNPKSTFLFRGYMPGEVYSFGIVYIFSDGYISPVFHIPGRAINHPTSKMKVYEGDTRYLDIHNCSVNNYWNKDVSGNNLVNQKHRHHRFPFRKEVNKPLVTTASSTSTNTKYRVKINITLASGREYPKDVNDDPASINFDFKYQITGAGSQSYYTGLLTESDIGRDFYMYDDFVTLTQISGAYAVLEPLSTLAGYQSPGNDTFVITITYESYSNSTTFNEDRSEIFGINFSNIEKPHPDVVGFYIVRNERTEDDKIIVDNAVFGSMTEFQQYKSFGLITPKQFYPANNCGVSGDAGKTLTYYKKGVWFFNPEFQFFNKKTDFDKVEVEGVYNQASISIPTISDNQGSECNYGNGKGLYINDVQAGTSYNPDIHKKKNKDDDGFDLLIGYKNTSFTFTLNSTLIFPTKRLVLYLNAASYQNLSPDVFYNTSVDNKIGQYLTPSDIDANVLNTLHTGDNKNNLIYGALTKNNTTSYSNFITKPYYKEHNNPIYFGASNTVNNIKIFNGDAEISGLNMVSSVFYDIVTAERPKKTGIWKIVVGSVLVIAAVAATVLTAGAASASVVLAVGSLATAAVSYGVALAVSGIKLEQLKSMIDDDYEKGLKETVFDGGMFEQIRDTVNTIDDTIRWFSDRASNIYIESSVPFGLRAGITSGVSDFLDAPSPYNEVEFRTYLTEKFTMLDRDQGTGRLYKGYAGAEFYDVNKDYLRFNKQKIFIHLPVEYDCCSDQNEIYPTRCWYSEQSFQEERIDNYRVFLPNNYKDIEGEHGEITNLFKQGNSLFIEVREALWKLPASNQERVIGEIVSFIGTGEFFSIPPIKVVDDNLGSGGTQHKWATLKTNMGVISVNEIQNKIFLYGEGLKDITVGHESWFKNNLKPFLLRDLYNKLEVTYLHANNPANPNGIGYLSTYDSRYKRVLITKKDYSILQEKLSLLKLVTKIPTINNDDFSYCLEDGLFYHGTTQVKLDNANYFQNRSWTISYSFTQRGFISLHSYLPNYYIHSQNNLYSFVAGSNSIWKHHREGHFQTFYGKYNPFIISYVPIQDPINDRTLEDLTLHTTARRFDPTTNTYREEELITFNKINASNTKQSTGDLIIKAKDLQPNPENWYNQQTVNIPGVVLASKTERNWNINDLRDQVVNYKVPLFTSEWNIIKFSYPIDEVVNQQAVSFDKPWEDLQVLRDKYVIIRLKFDNFNDVNLLFNYSIDTEPISNR